MDDKEKSREYFDGHSKTVINRNGYWSRDYRATSEIFVRSGAKDIVDIGCGNGAFLAAFHLASPRTRISGLDLSHEMVLRSRERLPVADITEGDAEDMPYGDGAFDGVSCHMSVHHHPHPDRSLGEMYRILKPGGTVVINELTGPKWLRRLMNWCFRHMKTGDHAVYSEKEMTHMLRNAGFERITSRRISPLSYVCVGTKL